MATIDLPTSGAWKVAESALKLDDVRWVSESVFTRTQQQYPAAGGYFWAGHVKLVARTHESTADIEGWLDQACEAGNLIRMPHPRWAAPRGTLRGTPTLTGAHSAGASSLQIHGTAGATLLRGDLIGVTGHLLRVQADTTFDGSGDALVSVRGRLRTSLANGTSVVWSAPTATFQAKSRPDVVYLPGYGAEFVIDLVERWT